MKYSSQSHGSDEQRRMETRAKHPRCPISAGTLQGTIFKNRDRAILLFYEASWRTEKVGGLLGHQAPPMGVPAKHSSSQDSTRSIRCASSTEKCLPCRGEKAAAALLLLQRQHLPHVKHKITSSPTPLPAGPKPTGSFLTALSSSFSKKSSPGCPVTFRIWVS